MQILDKRQQKEVEDATRRRIAEADRLPYSGALRFARIESRGQKCHPMMRAMMTDVLTYAPTAGGPHERTLVLRFGLVMCSPDDGWTNCYDALYEDGALVCAQLGLDYGGPPMLYALAPTEARLRQIMETCLACGFRRELTPEAMTPHRMRRVHHTGGFGCYS